MSEVELPLKTLAYLGDAIYELWVREHFIEQARVKHIPSEELHKLVTHWVRAETQEQILFELKETLPEDWQDILRRARNVPPPTGAKRSKQKAYRSATALEALIGWLSLNHEIEKLGVLKSQLLSCLVALEKESSNK